MDLFRDDEADGSILSRNAVWCIVIASVAAFDSFRSTGCVLTACTRIGKTAKFNDSDACRRSEVESAGKEEGRMSAWVGLWCQWFEKEDADGEPEGGEDADDLRMGDCSTKHH